MAQSGAVAGLCPTTEANLGDGIFPGVDYLAQRGHWGIGSDSHVSLNVVEELRWFEYGQRLRDQRRNRLTTATQNVVGDVLYTRRLPVVRRPVARLSGDCQWGIAPTGWCWMDRILPGGSPPPEILNRWLFAGHAGQIRDVYVGGTPALSMRQHAHNRPVAADFLQVLRQLAEATAMTGWQRFSQTRLPVSRWRNGGGEAREIISWPAGAGGF